MKTIKDQANEPDGLRRYLVPWGIYIDGARAMLLKLREYGLLAGTATRGKSEDRVYSKAIIDMLIESKDNADRFLTDDFDEIRYSGHNRDKKGRLLGCKAYFAKRMTIYKKLN